MPPEENTPQPAPESPSPAVEVPAPESAPTASEPAPAPSEAVPAPLTAQPTTPTAQIPLNEPIAQESEPIETTPEPPSSAAASTPTPSHPIRDFLNKARIATQDRKRKKRDKIMTALTTKNKITNDEVEKLLHVSDATATRYLSALEKEGKIKQVGKTGHGVVYSKI